MKKQLTGICLLLVLFAGVCCLHASAKNQIPAAVQNLKCTKITDCSLTLSWKASKPVSSYWVYQAVGNEKFQRVQSGVNDTKCIVSALKPSKVYRFQVKAVLKKDGKNYLSEKNPVITVKTLPAKVSGFSAGEIGAKTARLSWKKQSGVTGYILYKKNSENGKYFAIATVVSQQSYRLTNLTANGSYTYAVKAYYLNGSKKVCSPAYATLSLNTSPKKVGELKAELSNARVKLTWKAPKKAQGYVVYLKTQGKWKEIGSTTATFFTKKILKSGNTYTFGVKVYRKMNGKKQISSDIASVSSRSLPAAPDFTFTKKGDVYSLRWKTVKSANEYMVFSMLPGGEWKRVGVTKNTSFSFTQKKAPELFLSVKAVCVQGKQKYISGYYKKLCSTYQTKGSVISIGDSIANGAGSNGYAYSELFARKYRYSLKKVAVNGASMCRCSSEHTVIADAVLDSLKKGAQYDYIFLEGGCNDYFYNAPLGEVSTEGTKNFNMNSVCGALEASFAHIRSCAPKARVVFVIVHNASGIAQKPNALGLTFTDYVQKMIVVCNKYGVHIANCLDSGMDTAEENLSKKYTFRDFGILPNGDGLHPNEKAYEKYYYPIIESAAFERELPPEPAPEIPPDEPIPESEATTDSETAQMLN